LSHPDHFPRPAPRARPGRLPRGRPALCRGQRRRQRAARDAHPAADAALRERRGATSSMPTFAASEHLRNVHEGGERMTHPTAELVGRFYGLFARGEMHTMADYFAEDFLFIPAGKHNQLAGPRRGAGEILRFTARQMELTDGTWIPRPYDLL